MWFIQVLLSLLVAHMAASKAVYPREAMTSIYDMKTARSGSPTLSHRDSTCTNKLYGANNPSEMCGDSTFSSLTDVHCRTGDASLVDDCNALIADLEALNGGGFWGFTQQGTLVIASHGTCTFHLEKKNGSSEFAIGTEDVIDIAKSAIGMSSVAKECNGKNVMAATGAMSCKYKGTTIDTTWWIEGPYSQCDS